MSTTKTTVKNPMLGKAIYYYHFSMSDGKGIGARGTPYEMVIFKRQKVVYENDEVVILNTRNLANISKDKGFGTALDKPFLHLRVGDVMWGNTLEFTLYTDDLLTVEDVKALIKEEVKKRTSLVFSADLSAMDTAEIEDNFDK